MVNQTGCKLSVSWPLSLATFWPGSQRRNAYKVFQGLLANRGYLRQIQYSLFTTIGRRTYVDSYSDLIDSYESGPAALREAVEGMTSNELRTRVSPGRWSVHEVLCHLADFEVINADRIRRVLCEREPTLFNGKPDDFERGLAYAARDSEEELKLIELLRRQVARILRASPAEVWERRGIHSTDGPLTLRQLVERVTRHIPHHIEFIAGKRALLTAES